MTEFSWKGALSNATTMPVWIYRLVVLSGLIIITLLFTTVDNGFCTSTAAISVGKDESYSCVEYWINRYQGLIGGILALLGAGLAFYAVRTQIDQTERLSGIAISRKGDAITAVAPFALSAMVDYSAQCMDIITESRLQVLAGLTHPIMTVPNIPLDLILIIKDYIEYGDQQHTKSAANVLYTIQIQQSRIHSLQEKIAPGGIGLFDDIELQDAMFDALDLHAQVSILFRPTRRDYSMRIFEIDNMYNDLRVRGLEIDEWPRLKFKIEAFGRSQAKK